MTTDGAVFGTTTETPSEDPPPAICRDKFITELTVALRDA